MAIFYTISMNYSRTYGGVIWTNHALERLQGRKIPQEIAWKAFRFPETTQKGKAAGSFEFIKKLDIYTVTIIAKKNDRREWIIVSCWIDPPLPGSVDLRAKVKKTSTFAWMISVFKRAFFGNKKKSSQHS